MTLGQLLDCTKLYGRIAVYRDAAIDEAEEFSCDANRLPMEAVGDSGDENLLECDVLSMFAKTLDGQSVLCIGLDWDGDEW